MKFSRALVVPCFLLLVLLSSTYSTATYVKDDTIVLLRSQYLDDTSTITIDGKLTEDAWAKAGSIEISYNTSKDVLMRILFTNNNYDLYFGMEFTGLTLNENNSILLVFDVDGNGVLNTPEDAKYIDSSGIYDYYWDKTNWVIDRAGSQAGVDFKGARSVSSSKLSFELQMPLVADSVTYDGFRIASPTNTVISFDLVYNETSLYQFPTKADNASGFVDLKLAGPEDQDLPEFIPPEVVTDTNPGNQAPVNDVFGTVDAALNTQYYYLLIFLPVMAIIGRRRTR